jgi:lysophospholipase L1-like esterase
MKANDFARKNGMRFALVAAVLVISACDAANEIVDEIDNIGNDAEIHYYVSLGTSLSVGVQPNGSGVLLPTDDGYADQLYRSIRPAFEAVGNRELQHIKLGCPGEDIDKMVNGGSCIYVAGSQLDAAVDFLTDEGANVFLVTLDMGANDFRNAGCVDETAVDQTCANLVSAQISLDLAPVLTALTDAADPNTTIAGMNYYNPYLTTWLVDLAGQTVAMESALAVSVLNDFLSTTYLAAGIPMADVALAFASDDFTLVESSLSPPDMIPLNVDNICVLTYMCDDTRGPDIHANDAGYGVIADAFTNILP